MALTSVTLNGHYEKPDGSACGGTVRFRLVAPIQDQAGHILVAATEHRVELDGDGEFSVELPATSGDDLLPTDNAYIVIEEIEGQPRREYQADLVSDEAVQYIDQFVPIVARPSYLIAGPEGPVGPNGGPVPEGGTDGQLVVKDGDEDFAVQFAARSSVAADAAWATRYASLTEARGRANGLQATSTLGTLAAAITGDGVVDDHTALGNFLTSSPGVGRGLRSGEYLDATSTLTVTDSLLLSCEKGTIFRRSHGSNLVIIKPAIHSTATTSSSQSAGDSTVVCGTPGWSTNDKAGMWAEVAYTVGSAWDSGTTYAEGDVAKVGTVSYVSLNGSNLNNPPATSPTYWERLGSQSRRVVSNTSTTLTLDEPFGGPVASGSTVTFYDPIERVDISNLTFQGTGTGSALVVIMYVRDLRLTSCGAVGATGNGFSIYHCDRVRIYDPYTEDTNFGGFVYNSRNVRIYSPICKSWKSSYGWQMKDCVDGRIIDGWGDGGAVGRTAFNAKGSGLNPARDMGLVNCGGTNTIAPVVMLHSLKNEGSYFAFENGYIHGGSSTGGAYGWYIQEGSGGSIKNATVRGFSSYGATAAGFAIAANDVYAEGILVENCVGLGGLITGSRCTVKGKFKNNNYGGSANAEVRITGGVDNIVDADFLHTDATSLSNTTVREMNSGENRNLIIRRIIDTAGTPYSNDVVIVGAASRAIQQPELDTVASATNVYAVDARPVTKTLAADAVLSTVTLGNLTGFSRAVSEEGRYRFRIVLVVDAAIDDDVKVAVTGPSGVTGYYGLSTAPQLGATASGNQSNRHNVATSFGTALPCGTIGVGSRAIVAVEGLAIIGSNSGTLQVQAAQNAHTTGDTTVYAGSFVTFEKVA